ncbi:hypothetical protein CaCOL14_009000 [Colletotrichum acutatum]
MRLPSNVLLNLTRRPIFASSLFPLISSSSPTIPLTSRNTARLQRNLSTTTTSRFRYTSPTMAVPPKFAAHKLTFGAEPEPSADGVPAQPHTIELYLDYVCPYSAKQFNTFYNAVVPAIRANPTWAANLEVVFRQQVQPWHPSSTLVHESAVAVVKVAPSKFWAYSDALFKAQKDYFDANVVNEPRNETYKRLAKLAGTVGVDEKAVLDLLVVSDKPDAEGALNVGNGVTNDFKVLIKLARLTGVHVSPTVLFDGYPNNEISSGWTLDQWKEWLQKNIV